MDSSSRFAAEKLAAQRDEEAQVRSRHANFYAQRMTEAGWELEPGDRQITAQLDQDGPNVVAVWHWAVQTRNVSMINKMMKWMVDFYRRPGNPLAGWDAFDVAVQAFRDSPQQPANTGLLGSLLMR